jgi:hypothetical protein
MPEPRLIELSAATGAGFEAWLDWLERLPIAGADLEPGDRNRRGAWPRAAET